MENKEDKLNPNLRHSQALNEQPLKFGVPANIFMVALAVTVASLFFSLGLSIFFFFVLLSLIKMHKDDHLALSFLLDNLRRPDKYNPSLTKQGESKLLCLGKEDNFYIQEIK